MYEAFFGLKEKAFSIQPDPEFLFWGRGHSMAFAMLQYGLANRAGFTVITGEVGAGKTTLVRHLLSQIQEDCNVGLIANFHGTDQQLLHWILMSLDLPFEGETYVTLHKRFQDYLKAEHAKGRRTILIIDEAQNLGVDYLEELRMLSNINVDKDQLLQLILVGQPQLKDLLQRPDMIQFCQRVASDFHIRPLLQEETLSYIDHRMVVAGGHGDVFTEEAKELVFQASRGVPRVINILCDTALVYAFAEDSKKVTERIIKHVLIDKKQYGVFQIEGTRDWPAPLQKVSPLDER